MATNGLINGNMAIPDTGYAIPAQPDMSPQGPAQPEIDAGQLFAQWLEQNPNASPQEIFAAGLNTGLSGGALPPPIVYEGMGFPAGAQEFVPPLDEFGPDVAPIPGMGTETEQGFRTVTPYNADLPRYVSPQQNGVGVPQGQPPEDFVIDMTDILGTPRGA
jgi:hypothetical protein